jgi:DNA-binding XRE family transcriptional regulator
MTLQEQKQLVELINHYNSIDRKTLQNRIILYIDKSGYKNKALADFLGVSEQTIYGWRKADKFNVPAFETAIKLMDILNISITELIR